MNYDNFHSHIKVQKKTIGLSNFTYRYALKLINSIPKSSRKTILDYGCGVGTIDFFLAKEGSKIIGLELSKKAIDMCKRSAKAIGVSESCKFYNLSSRLNQKFDLIICSEVIEHVRDDDKLIKFLCSLLKKNGFIYISTPSINAPLYRLGLLNNFDKNVGHLRRYQVSDLAYKMKINKLNIIKLMMVEGILRNSLFVFPGLNWIVKFLKGPLSDISAFLDELLVKIFGESNIIILAQKI